MMKKELQQYLVEKYEPLYRGTKLPATENLMAFGFEVGDGWFNIIDTLSFMLCSEWLQAKRIRDRIINNEQYSADDINDINKRIIEAEKNIPLATQVKEKFGSLRFYVNKATDTQYDLISLAENLSAITCEICGAPGTMNEHGWIKCRCEQHKDD